MFPMIANEGVLMIIATVNPLFTSNILAKKTNNNKSQRKAFRKMDNTKPNLVAIDYVRCRVGKNQWATASFPLFSLSFSLLTLLNWIQPTLSFPSSPPSLFNLLCWASSPVSNEIKSTKCKKRIASSAGNDGFSDRWFATSSPSYRLILGSVK